VHASRLAAGAVNFDPITGEMPEESLGHLRSRAIAGAEEEDTHAPASRCNVSRRRSKRKPWVQRLARRRQQLAASPEIEAVVGVSPISRASPHRYQAARSQPREVI
jgi:hypothetical protein